MRRRLFYSTFLAVLSSALIAVSTSGAQDRPSTQTNPSTRQEDQKGTPNRPATTRENDQSTQRSDNGKLTEQSFVQQAYEANQNEVKVAQLAKTRANSANVKRYAQQLETDHMKALDMLRKHAVNNRVTLPNDARSTTNRTSSTSTNRSNTDGHANNVPSAMARTADSPHLQELSNKSGTEFDKAFIDMMVEDHQKAISLFERANTEKFSDAGLRGFVSSQLPGLRNHLARAQQLQKEVGTKTTADTSKPNTR